MSMKSMTYPPPITFSTVNSMSISVNNSNFNFDFLTATCHGNPGGERNEQDSYSKISQIFQLAIMYCVANHGIHPGVFIQILSKLLLCACSLHQ